MTIENEEQLEKLRTIGKLVARTLTAMGAALEPGMTTRELDDLGRALLEKEGARSAPELTYDFPGATCISVGPDCAHGIPDDTAIKAGDLLISMSQPSWTAISATPVQASPSRRPAPRSNASARMAAGRCGPASAP